MEPPILHIPPHGRRVVHAQTEEAINAEIYIQLLYILLLTYPLRYVQ